MIGGILSAKRSRIIGTFALLFALLGCSANQKSLQEYEIGAKQPGFSDKLRYFFSEENQRALTPDVGGQPLLATNSRGQRGRAIDTRWVNGENAQNGRPGTAFFFNDEETKVLLNDTSLNQSNRQEISVAGGVGPRAKSDVVRLNFRGETLDYFIRQTLGGILQVNYVIDEPLEGTVEFKTEKPIAKDQMLSLVRVMLGRNGYILKLIDQIFHIGKPETIQAIEQFSGVGSVGDLKLRILPVNSASAADAAEVLQAIIPRGASAINVAGTNNVAIRARPEDLQAIEELVNNLYNRNNDRTIVAVLRLQQSSANQVAAQVITLFEQLYPNQTTSPLTVIPLESQQSLLVAVKTKQMLQQVRRITKEVDFNLLDSPKVRIITLKYLPAGEIATQLTQIIRNGNSAGAPAASTKQASSTTNSLTGPGKPRQRVITATGQEVPPANNSGSNRFAASNALLDKAQDTSVSSISTGGRIGIVADTRNNALLVNSSYAEFKHIREVVRALDRPLSQVIIEATIVEVTINDKLNYGVQWYLRKGLLGGGSGTVASGAQRPSDAGGALSLNTFGVDVVLKALQQITKVKVISSPYLTVLDGRQARLVIGDQIPFAERSQSSNNDNGVTVTNEVSVRDTGIVLEVEPNIRSNNSVLLNINQQVSNVVANQTANTLTPTITTRTVNSDIVVESGRTVLLGGLIQETKEQGEAGVPVLRKVPVLGELFKSGTTSNGKRTELLIMITPRVVRKQSELQNITDQLRRELSSF